MSVCVVCVCARPAFFLSSELRTGGRSVLSRRVKPGFVKIPALDPWVSSGCMYVGVDCNRERVHTIWCLLVLLSPSLSLVPRIL